MSKLNLLAAICVAACCATGCGTTSSERRSDRIPGHVVSTSNYHGTHVPPAAEPPSDLRGARAAELREELTERTLDFAGRTGRRLAATAVTHQIDRWSGQRGSARLEDKLQAELINCAIDEAAGLLIDVLDQRRQRSRR